MVVLLELRSDWVSGQDEGIDVAKDNDGTRDEVEGLLPVLPAYNNQVDKTKDKTLCV